jgi:hypothetical protein
MEKQIHDILMVLAWPLVIGGVAGAVTAFVLARQLSASREDIRKLRVALERDPSPNQLGEALTMWPEVKQYPQTHQLAEMVNRAHKEEGKRAERYQVTMGISRFFVALAVLGAGIWIAGRFWDPQEAPAQAPDTTAESS